MRWMLCVALLFHLISARTAAAEAWPTRHVSLVVVNAAGGLSDIMARLLANRLGERLGKTFVVENRVGAASTIGAAYVAKAAPNGYTLMWGQPTPIIISPMSQKVTYDAEKDFVPISIFGSGAFFFAVNAELPVKTLPEFIAYAKERPGTLNYASVGTGGQTHLMTALFAKRTGIEMQHIPYNGVAASLGLITGAVQVYFGTAAEIAQHISGGKIRVLATSAPKRLAKFPDIPAINEYLPGFRLMSWNGPFAPAGTPPEIVAMLEKETIAAGQDPAMMEKLLSMAIEPWGSTQAEMREMIAADRTFYRDAFGAAELKMQGQ